MKTISQQIGNGAFDGLRERFIGQGVVSKITYVDIVAERNEDDFNSIREIMKGITDASEYKRYRILVPEGEWFECDIQGKKYVEIIGAGIDKTILYCDGNSTNLTPSDYSVAGYENVPLNSFPRGSKHVFYSKYDVVALNMTIRGTEIRYCMHIDTDTYDYVHVKKVRFDMITDRPCIGLGVRGHQEVIFDQCVFEINKAITTIPKTCAGIFIHNHVAAQTKPMKFTVMNSQFVRCVYMNVECFNTTQVDELNLINCTTDSMCAIRLKKGGKVNSSIKINASGTNVEKIVSVPDVYYTDVLTPAAADFLYNIHTNFAKKAILPGVVPGALIQGDVTYTEESLNQYSIYDGTGLFTGIAVTATDAEGFIYVATSGKIAKAPVTGVATKFIKINESNQLEFEATKSINTIGINLGLVSTGIYEIKLL
jgi:hypothetical protein